MTRKAKHTLLGDCLYTPACEKLQSSAAPDTVFVEHDNEVVQVSRSLVKFAGGRAKGSKSPKTKLKPANKLVKTVSLTLQPAVIALFDSLRGSKSRGKYITRLLKQEGKKRSMVKQ